MYEEDSDLGVGDITDEALVQEKLRQRLESKLQDVMMFSDLYFKY